MKDKLIEQNMQGIAQSFAYGAEQIAASNIMLAAIQLAGGAEPTDEHFEMAQKAFKKALHPFEKRKLKKKVASMNSGRK